MAAAMAHVRFVTVDVDQCKGVRERYAVTATPTFKMLRGGREVGSMQGAVAGTLRQMVQELTGHERSPRSSPPPSIEEERMVAAATATATMGASREAVEQPDDHEVELEFIFGARRPFAPTALKAALARLAAGKGRLLQLSGIAWLATQNGLQVCRSPITPPQSPMISHDLV